MGCTHTKCINELQVDVLCQYDYYVHVAIDWDVKAFLAIASQ